MGIEGLGGLALVTGAGSGIGRGIALGLARRGIGVVLVGRRVALLEETAALLPVDTRVAILPCDLRERAARADLAAQVYAQVGRPLSILVNNAAVLAGGPLAGQSAGAIREAVALNLEAPLDLLRLCLADLRQTRGVVAMVASGTSRVPLPYLSLYTATKMGVEGFAQAVRFELRGLGVHLLLAYPPSTATAMTANMARAARIPAWMQADALWVGERIAAGIVARRAVVDFWSGERVLGVLYRAAPGLTRFLLQRVAGRFARLFEGEGVGQNPGVTPET